MFTGIILIKREKLEEIVGAFETDDLTLENTGTGNKWVVLDFGDNTFLPFKEIPTDEEIFYVPSEWIPFNRFPEEQVEKIRRVGTEI